MTVNSCFNVYGLVGESSYQGLAIDNNGIFLALLFVFHDLVSTSVFTTLLYLVILALAVLNVAPVRTPKLGVGWYYGITAYILARCLFFGWQLLRANV